MKKKNKNQMRKKKNSKGRLYFLISVVLLYLMLIPFFPNKSVAVLKFFIKLLLRLIPIFIFVYAIMLLIYYFVNKAFLRKYMGEESGVKGWLIAIITGIISTGPMYVWYPLMKELRKNGVKDRYLATFLYNRGIKPAWLPLLIFYFGWFYSLTLLTVMAVLSILQGLMTERIIKVIK